MYFNIMIAQKNLAENEKNNALFVNFVINFLVVGGTCSKVPFIQLGEIGHILVAYHMGAFFHTVALAQIVGCFIHSHIEQILLHRDAGLFFEKSA